MVWQMRSGQGCRILLLPDGRSGSVKRWTRLAFDLETQVRLRSIAPYLDKLSGTRVVIQVRLEPSYVRVRLSGVTNVCARGGRVRVVIFSGCLEHELE